jgi:hypothetical protein
MNTIGNAKSLEQVVAAISAMDLEPVKSRVMDAELGEGWSREYADSIEAAYKTYLTMLVKYPGDSADIMLAKDVDEFWHTHILQTVKYSEDCEQVFGFYLHHFPHVGERNAEDLAHRETLAAKTRQLYEREFGPGERAEMAWAGASAVTARRRSAQLTSDIVVRRAAYSTGPGIAAQTAAYSTGPHIAGQTAAYSTGPHIAVQTAAYSTGPHITAQAAAYSTGPHINAQAAAYSTGPHINAQAAAYSTGPGNAVMQGDASPAHAG